MGHAYFGMSVRTLATDLSIPQPITESNVYSTQWIRY